MSVRRTSHGLCCSNSRLSKLSATVFVQIAFAFLRQGLACRRKAMQAVLTHEPLDFFTLSSLLTISRSNSNFLSGLSIIMERPDGGIGPYKWFFAN